MLVYADWLTQQGDPRGELIVVQHARSKNPDDDTLDATEARLLLDRRLSPFASTNTRLIEWRLGFIRSARIHDTSGLHRLLRHPASSLLRNLWLDEAGRNVLAVLRDGPDLPLRQLVVLASYADGVTIDLGGKFPHIEHLEIEGYDLPFTEAAMPALRRLYLRTRSFSEATAHAITKAPFRHLEELEIRFDDSDDYVEPIMFAGLFERADLAALRVVRFGNGNGRIAYLLARAPFAHKLETIDLFDTFTGDTAIQELVAAREQFASLRTLIVNPTHGDQAPLRRAFGERLRTETVARPFATWRQ